MVYETPKLCAFHQISTKAQHLDLSCLVVRVRKLCDKFHWRYAWCHITCCYNIWQYYITYVASLCLIVGAKSSCNGCNTSRNLKNAAIAFSLAYVRTCKVPWLGQHYIYITVLRHQLAWWLLYKQHIEAGGTRTTFLNVFSSMKIFELQLQFHWSLLLGVQLTIFQHWFR